MCDGDANDYNKLNKVLLTKYNFNDDGYKRFREVKPVTEEASYQFVIRLKNYLAKWLDLSGSSSGDFDALVDLIVKEQFINACSEELTKIKGKLQEEQFEWINQPMKVLRDTGCTGMIVDRGLILAQF